MSSAGGVPVPGQVAGGTILVPQFYLRRDLVERLIARGCVDLSQGEDELIVAAKRLIRYIETGE